MFGPGGPSFFDLARQALTSTDRGYDLLAQKFDATPFRTPATVTDRLRAVYDEAPIARAIDLCCGTGAGVESALWVATQQVVGIDRSHGMLTQAVARVPREGPRGAKATFHQQDATKAPAVEASFVTAPPEVKRRDLEAESFDLATCFGAFGHIEPHEEQPFVGSVRRYLKVGGRFVFVTADPPPLLSRQQFFARAFNAAMHVRNALITPRFVMFYLTFLLPRATALLQANDFAVDVRRDLFPEHPQLLAVVATKRARSSA